MPPSAPVDYFSQEPPQANLSPTLPPLTDTGDGGIIGREGDVGDLAKPYPDSLVPDRVKSYLSRLNGYGSTIILSANETASPADISLMARQEGVEFAVVSIDGTKYIIRGDAAGTPLSKAIFADIEKNHGTLECHAHPFVGDLRPSKEDLALTKTLSWQKEFIIVTPDGQQCIYGREGIIRIEDIPYPYRATQSEYEQMFKEE